MFLLMLWFVVSESYSHPFKSNSGFSHRQGNRLHRTILPKHARMMFSGIVEVVTAIFDECELSLPQMTILMVVLFGYVGDGFRGGS